MTNEEWLNNLNTEQKAEWFAQNDCDDLLPNVPTEIKEALKRDWLDWLKSEHKE